MGLGNRGALPSPASLTLPPQSCPGRKTAKHLEGKVEGWQFCPLLDISKPSAATKCICLPVIPGQEDDPPNLQRWLPGALSLLLGQIRLQNPLHWSFPHLSVIPDPQRP